MKLWKMLGMFGLLSMIVTGCTTVNTNDAASDSKQAMVPAVYEPVIKHVNKKVSGEATVHVVLNVFKWGDNKFADRAILGTKTDPSVFDGLKSLFPNPVEMVKTAAVYNACKANNCDILIGSKYEITVKDYFVYKFMNCKVSGFPGTEVGVVKKDVSFPNRFTGKMEVPVYPLN